MAVVVRIDGRPTAWRLKRGVRWTAACDELGLHADGESEDALLDAIRAALSEALRALHARGDLAEVLTTNGWSALPAIPADLGEDVAFDVPFELSA